MKKICIAISLITFFASCSESVKVAKENEVIGQRSDDLISVNVKDIRDSIDMPLSEWIEDLEIVQLDGSTDEAFVGHGNVYVSDDYFVISYSDKPIKLFDRKTGKYITKIGNVGRGPGEYMFVYSIHVDQKNDRIYIMPWSSSAVNIYDFKGAYVGNIPLAFMGAPKSHIVVDPKNKHLTVAALSFIGSKSDKAIWSQDFDGNLISSVDAGHLAVYGDFSNEVDSYRNSGNIDYHVLKWNNEPDTVYHYIQSENRLKPVFTIVVDDLKPAKSYADAVLRSYNDIPGCFIGGVSRTEQVSNGNYQNTPTQWFYVDKESLRGAWFKLKNDFLGDMEEYPFFSQGYFISNREPFDLIDKLNKLRDGADSKARERIDELLKKIDEDGNNVIMVGKLKGAPLMAGNLLQ